jgi:hypothetical protein
MVRCLVESQLGQRYLIGETEENHKGSQSKQRVTHVEFKPGSSCIQSTALSTHLSYLNVAACGPNVSPNLTSA